MTHHPRGLLLLFFVLAGGLLFLAADRRSAYASSASDREHGALVFHKSGCEQCHSITGVGGDRAPDLGSVGQRRDPASIKAQILKGGHGMPPFAKVLSKEEVKALVAFLAACRSDAAPGCRQWMPPQ
jgi:mono/diheme cytochrome c family protein